MFQKFAAPILLLALTACLHAQAPNNDLAAAVADNGGANRDEADPVQGLPPVSVRDPPQRDGKYPVYGAGQ